MPQPTPPPAKKLWAFQVRTHDGDRSEVLGIVFAPDDSEAMRLGFLDLEERELLAQTQEAYHVPKSEDADDGEGGFFTCEEITDVDGLTAALDGIPALSGLFSWTWSMASAIWYPMESELKGRP